MDVKLKLLDLLMNKPNERPYITKLLNIRQREFDSESALYRYDERDVAEGIPTLHFRGCKVIAECHLRVVEYFPENSG